jgi:hypothetical protein
MIYNFIYLHKRNGQTSFKKTRVTKKLTLLVGVVETLAGYALVGPSTISRLLGPN